MKIKQVFLVKKHGMSKLILLLLGSLSTAVSIGGILAFSIVPTEPVLSIYFFPVQNAQANSNFSFNLSSYFSVLQPEVDYLVTNNLYQTMSNLSVTELPNGVQRIFNGERVCAERFNLEFKQSCTLRFVVDMDKYNYSMSDGPAICPDSIVSLCHRPDWGSRFDDAVSRLTGPTRVLVTPSSQDGLWYDSASLSIVGMPTKAGVYVFSVSASNDRSTTVPRDLQIEVGINPRDTPVFKADYIIPSATSGQHYRLNLLELIEPIAGFMVNNQVSFIIDKSKAYPEWLFVDSINSTILQGDVPSEEAGQQKKVTIIASSNTGGQSEPLTITIPVAYDPDKKPVIDQNIKLFGEAGRLFNSDLRMNIVDPASNSSVKIVIDTIEPPAPWLKVSSYKPTKLEGVIPEESVGIEYQITLHANTETGGNSDSVTIPFQVAVNERLTPHFYAANPQFPMLYEGQAFLYDFVENNDIDPAYSSIPYQIKLADGYPNPSWLRLEDNKLIADIVPEHLNQVERLFITIKNLPGGKSQVIALKLFVMN